MNRNKTFTFREYDILISRNIYVRDVNIPAGFFQEDNNFMEDCFV